MRTSFIIVSFFVIGIVLGLYIDSLQVIIESDITTCVLYLLMFVVGVGIGCDKAMLNALKKQNIKVILLPLGTIVGTLVGAMVVYPLVLNMELKDVLAVSSGFAYYSLSSILLTEYRGVEVGTIALITNIIREIFTILFAGVLVKVFGRLSLISAAGATSLDTSLPIVARFSGNDLIVLSIFHGLILELSVPILVTIFAEL